MRTPGGLARVWNEPWVRTGLALAVVGAVSGAIALARPYTPVAGLSVLYIAAVLVVAIVAGRAAAVTAAVASFLAFDLLFVVPYYTVTVADPVEWITLSVLLLTGLVTAQLATLVRRRTDEARLNERAASVLYRVAHVMAGESLAGGLQETAAVLTNAVGATAVTISVSRDPEPLVASSGDQEALRYVRGLGRYGEGRILASAEDAANGFRPRRWISTRTGLRHRQPGRFDVYHVRIGTDGAGWVTVALPPGGPPLDAITQRLLSATADEVAEAVERDRLRHEATEVEALRRADELRTILLNTVSHDLRTPLAAIVAAADSLRSDIDWKTEERREFIDAITGEAHRLDQMVRHLLDLSRIESGTLALTREWHDPADVVAATVARLRDALPGRRIVLHAANDLSSAVLDPVAIGEVVANLVENACRHTPPETAIDVRVEDAGGDLRITVADDGPGIPADVLPHLFEPFARERGLRDQRGTGLGLAVAHALVAAHGGTIAASNAPGGGARFVVTLPRPAGMVPPRTEA
ncbi:MAG: ATP-binding protein [Dehalococcoidia bacterium]